MNTDELRHCRRCNRMNWHEQTHCSWCNRKLEKVYKWQRPLTHIMMLIAVASMITVAWRLM